MWCLQCCPCWNGSAESETENSGLMTGSKWQSKEAESNKTQYYTVRRISSFGRTGSGDDISDTGREQGDFQSPAEFWTPKVQRVQPGVLEGEYTGDSTDTTLSPKLPVKPPQRRRWRKALYPFKPQKDNKTQAWRDCRFIEPPPITVSTPDLQREEEEEEDSPPASPRLRHAGTVANVSSITVNHSPTKWLKSQSMQDINKAMQAAGDKKDGCAIISPQQKAAQIAKSYGLDTSLYTPTNTDCAPMSRSNEALNAWRSPANSDKLNLYQEAAKGLIHFSASYYQKNKRLLVHIDRLEGLPPKGNHYTYNNIVKLTVLPFEKPVRMSKIVKNDLNPAIEEDFEFYVKDPLGKVLRLSVYDADHQGKYDAVGHALFYLEDVIAGRPRRYAMRLYKQSQPDVAPGNIHVTLSYKRETMVVTVLVKEARNLLQCANVTKSSRLTEKYNTYVKVVYFSAGQKMKSKKTAVVSNSRNPTYNQTFSFKLSANFLHDSMIILSVMMKGIIKDMPIGRVILGPFHYAEERTKTPWGRAIVDEEEVCHWFRMYL